MTLNLRVRYCLVVSVCLSLSDIKHTVAVPSVEMVDDHGRVIEEKIYKVGSTIELKCVVTKVPGPTAQVMWRHGLRLLNYDTSRGGIR